MAAYKRVLFSHTYRVNYVILISLSKVDVTQIDKIMNSASKSFVCSKRTNRTITPKLLKISGNKVV